MDIEGANAEQVVLTLSNSKGEQVEMVYTPAEQTLTFDRTRSGLSDFSQDFATETVTPVYGKNKNLGLQLFIDRASVEVFANGGRGVMTNLVFPSEPYTTLSVSSRGGSAKLKNLKVYTIK